MATRRPLVIINGNKQELPVGDSLPCGDVTGPTSTDVGMVAVFTDTTGKTIGPSNVTLTYTPEDVGYYTFTVDITGDKLDPLSPVFNVFSANSDIGGRASGFQTFHATDSSINLNGATITGPLAGLAVIGTGNIALYEHYTHEEDGYVQHSAGINASLVGTTTSLDFSVNDAVRLCIGLNGQIGLGESKNYGSVNQVLTSGGVDQPVSWTDLPPPPETSPVFTYTSGQLSRIDYESDNYKLFTYIGSVLTQVDYVVGTVTTRKTFTYNPDGSLASITQTNL